MKLNKATLDSLRLDHGKTDQIFFDDSLPGFGCRLRSGGKRSWIVQYRIGAVQKRLTLGSVAVVDADVARAKAKTELAKVTLGGDPQAKKAEEKARAKHTLGAVAELYLAAHLGRLKPKTHSEAGRYLRTLWKPLHDLPLHKIARLDVTTRVSEINLKSGPSAAGHARLVLSALYAWAIGEGIADENPVIGSNAPATQKRDRVLSDAELAEIWRACPDDDYGRIVKLLALTGQRRGEVAAMTWSELGNLEEGVWRLPAERTKNGLPHQVPLAPLALEIIKGVTQVAGRDLLFGKGPHGFAGWGTPKLALDAKIQAIRKKAGAKPMLPWVVHDLRRAFATGAGHLGVQPHVIEAALNHVSGHKRGVAGVYNKSPYAREVRAAMALWGDHVQSVVQGAERKIVPFHKTALETT